MIFINTIKKFGKLLNKHQKLRIIELVVLMIVGGFMEMLSVSLIIPFMNAVMDPVSVMSKPYVVLANSIFGIEDHRTFLVFLALVMAGIYIVKNAFLLFQMNIQNRFVFNNMFMTQQRLLHNYLMRPYEYYLTVKSSEVLRVIETDTTAVFNMLTTLLQLASEMVVSVTLIGTLFIVAPAVTLGIAILLGLMLILIQFVLRPVLSKAGERNRDAYTQMSQWLLQSIQGIKEVKIMEKENFFEDNFASNGKIYVRTSRQNQTLSLIPRFMMEAISMGTFFVVVAVLIYIGMKLDEVVPMLSAVAMAAIRLLPSANRMSQSMAALAFGQPSLDKLIENIRENENYTEFDYKQYIENDIDEKLQFNDRLDLSNVTFRYPKGDSNVLESANMSIRKGEAVGIKGPSGAGKTTAVDVVLGLLHPIEGNVFVDGRDVFLNMHVWHSMIAYIPQSIFMLDASVRDNVAFGVPKDKIDDDKVWRALEQAAVDEDIRKLSEGLDTQLGERGIRLSGGQRQRIGIARALYTEPEILFFDEATSALDNETEKEIMTSVNRLHGEKTMIIIAHRLSTIEGCDHIYRVDNKKITRER